MDSILAQASAVVDSMCRAAGMPELQEVEAIKVDTDSWPQHTDGQLPAIGELVVLLDSRFLGEVVQTVSSFGELFSDGRRRLLEVLPSSLSQTPADIANCNLVLADHPAFLTVSLGSVGCSALCIICLGIWSRGKSHHVLYRSLESPNGCAPIQSQILLVTCHELSGLTSFFRPAVLQVLKELFVKYFGVIKLAVSASSTVLANAAAGLTDDLPEAEELPGPLKEDWGGPVVVGALRTIKTDLGRMVGMLPELALSDRASEVVEAAVRHQVGACFRALELRLVGEVRTAYSRIESAIRCLHRDSLQPFALLPDPFLLLPGTSQPSLRFFAYVRLKPARPLWTRCQHLPQTCLK